MTTNASVMQPYVFPYMGYFSLVQSSDIFIFYDDVNYIKQGWINRNRILINGAVHTFTIPLANGSSNELIMNVKCSAFTRFRDKFLKQLKQAYSKSKNFESGMVYVEKVLSYDGDSISVLAAKSVTDFYEHIDQRKDFRFSSISFPESKGLERSGRLINICKQIGACTYVNASGGQELYSKEYFKQVGDINLEFLKPVLLPYKQPGQNDFIPGLSVIDVVMNNEIDEIKKLINQYELI